MKIHLYGSSDDLVEIEVTRDGTVDADELNRSIAHFLVVDETGRRSLVTLRYNEQGLWEATVGQHDEDVPLTPIRITADGGHTVNVFIDAETEAWIQELR